MDPCRTTVDADCVMALDRDFAMTTYARQPVVFVRGEGARLWDSEGREYLDLLAGIAVCGVGHCHPTIVRAITEQAGALMHVCNLFHHPLQARLAERLCRLTGMERAFFGNSGAEANEAAIKIARKWGKAHGGDERHEIVTFHGSFHGRTLATVTATAQPKFQEAFKPLPAGFRYGHVGDVAGLDNLISERTCAVMIEPIQGESGVKPVSAGFLQTIRALCDEAGALMIVDEVQTGMGRTGSFLAIEASGVTPDIVTLAKSVASGVPMGVCLARGEAAATLVPGDHGSTFGGQPLACAAALAVLDVLECEGLMASAADVARSFRGLLEAIGERRPDLVAEVRGAGMMLGVELAQPVARAALKGMMARGVIANAVGDTVLRFLPPMVISAEQCAHAAAVVEEAVAEAAAGE